MTEPMAGWDTSGRAVPLVNRDLLTKARDYLIREHWGMYLEFSSTSWNDPARCDICALLIELGADLREEAIDEFH